MPPTKEVQAYEAKSGACAISSWRVVGVTYRIRVLSSSTLLKPSTINKYTYQDEGKRWLKKYDAIRFFVGYHKDRESALVEITDAVYNFEEQTVAYSLGRVFEVNENIP